MLCKPPNLWYCITKTQKTSTTLLVIFPNQGPLHIVNAHLGSSAQTLGKEKMTILRSPDSVLDALHSSSHLIFMQPWDVTATILILEISKGS